MSAEEFDDNSLQITDLIVQEQDGVDGVEDSDGITAGMTRTDIEKEKIGMQHGGIGIWGIEMSWRHTLILH